MFEVLYVLGWIGGGYLARKALRLDEEFQAALKGEKEPWFAESYVSAVPSSQPFPFSRIGGAWTHWVAVTAEDVWVWPMLLFRPTFIARIMGLERRLARESVRIIDVAPVQNALLGRRAVTISGKIRSGRSIVLRLYVRRVDPFVSALKGDGMPRPLVLSTHNLRTEKAPDC